MAGDARRLSPRGGGRRRAHARTVAGAAALGALGLLLGGCASGHAAALAQQACAHVATAERLQRASTAATPASAAQALEVRAERQLEMAEPLAAVAAGDDTAWQALQTTLLQAGTVKVPVLLPALRADCSSPGGDGG